MATENSVGCLLRQQWAGEIFTGSLGSSRHFFSIQYMGLQVTGGTVLPGALTGVRHLPGFVHT